MIWKRSAVLRFYSVCGLLLQAAASKNKVKGSQGQFPLTQNVTVVEGGTAILTCRVDQNDNTSLQWSNPAQQTLYFDDKKALRDNRIELVRASWHELSISVSDVSLSDEGQYTCSLFTMPVKTSKAYLTVLDTPSVKIIPSTPFPQEGQPLILTCESKGKPLPEPVLWTKDGGELPDPDRMVVSGRELNILFLNKTDNGTYRCEATNTIGQSSAEYVLIVHDPNALAGQTGPDHALIGGIVAVVVFVTLCSIFLLGRYLARHKGTYLTNEAKGAEDAPDADTAIINAEGSQVNAEEKKEYFI
uniref:Cell adhesion molecule 2 n=1 Tax=Propithecus coquereli TaxID=379532 RepID=A0A2K6F4Q6_PROCO